MDEYLKYSVRIVYDIILQVGMSEVKFSVLMVGRIYEEQAVFQLIQQAIQIISSHIKTTFYVTDTRTQQKISKSHSDISTVEFIPAKHHNLVDYIITIGGDGTILYAAKEFKSSIPPVVTFQRGTLGFMCRFSLVEMEEVLTKMVLWHKKQIEPPFEESKLMRLEVVKVNTREEEQTKTMKVCINEVYISRRSHERITLEIRVDDQLLTRTSGDGILISTPTGSTAYSLSAGGPILEKGVNGIMIVPISPNSLSFRPICLPSTSTITIKLHSSSRSEAYASFDGQTLQDFGFVHELIIRRSNNDVIFFEPKKGQNKLPSWIQRLKYFLGWNEKYKAPIHQFTPQKMHQPEICEWEKEQKKPQ